MYLMENPQGFTLAQYIGCPPGLTIIADIRGDPMKNPKHLGLFIEPEMHYKLQYVAKYEDRTISGTVMYLIRRYILAFEKKHGKIEVPQEEQQSAD